MQLPHHMGSGQYSEREAKFMPKKALIWTAFVTMCHSYGMYMYNVWKILGELL